MTTTGARNVHNVAIDGDFDDCQAIVKSLFADKDFSQSVNLSGVNSINWARIAAQSVYYATTQAALGADRPIRFVVPSGNMGDALAGYVAARCGMLSGFEIVCAVNENRALAQLFESGLMRRTPAVATPSPAMDISVPSNFERLLFEVSGRDGEAVRAIYDTYAQNGEAQLPPTIHGPLRCAGFTSQSVTNVQTEAEMKTVLEEIGLVICPHTAVGTYVARQLPKSDAVTVVLSTAHAAKFPETVEATLGVDAPLPPRCAALRERGEVFDRVEAKTATIQNYIKSNRS